MRIGFDAKRAYCNFRGLGNYSRNTIAALTRLRPENEYFLFTPKIAPEFQNLLFQHSEIITPQKTFDRALPSLWRSRGCINDISSLNLDVFHGLSHELPFGIEKTKTKSVVTIHDLIFVSHPDLYHFADRKTYTLKYRHSCKTADKIIAISEQTKADLINFWKVPEEKIDVVYQGCNPIFYEPVSQSEKEFVLTKYNLPSEYILNVGAIERRKNHELILRALRQTSDAIPLVIVGRDNGNLQTLMKEFPEMFGKRVITLNSITDNELRAIYTGASLFVYPSIYEGFGIPIIEALACGVPVVTTDDKCFREAGGNACHYINPHDHNQLAEEISLLLNDNAARSECVIRGAEQIRQFSEENIALNLSKIYESIL